MNFGGRGTGARSLALARSRTIRRRAGGTARWPFISLTVADTVRLAAASPADPAANRSTMPLTASSRLDLPSRRAR